MATQATEDKIVARALKILEQRAKYGDKLTSPTAVRDYLRLKLSDLEHEVFSVVFLSAQHQVIAIEEMFRGTLTQANVYPREVVKAALKHNAASVVFAHNHPSGVPDPSDADRHLTDVLKRALSPVDVRVIDHFVVAGSLYTSFAEKGWI